MNKLLLQINISLDGFVGDSDGKLEWMIPETDQRQVEFLKGLTNRAGVIILGRKMAIESIPHWEKIAKNQEQNQEVEFAKFFTKTVKVVFSKTIKTLAGENTIVENGSIRESVEKLKAKSKKDIIVYGGASFVASLIEHKLIDELNLFVHPVSLGRGLPIFNKEQKFKILKSECYDNGIVLNQYKIANDLRQ
jgi:dihydrofolate reductase